MRKHSLINGYTYHVFTKSIAGFKVFKSDKDYSRMLDLFKFYKVNNLQTRFSAYISLKDKENFINKFINQNNLIVEIYAYCLMPTHIH